MTNKNFDLLEPLLRITVTLDPNFKIAYTYGATFLSEPFPRGAGMPSKGVALIDEGIRQHPDHWRFYLDKGFLYFWYLQDYEKAAEIFLEGSRARGRSLLDEDHRRPRPSLEDGDRQTARGLWQILHDTAETPQQRENAAIHLGQLDALDQIDALRRVAALFEERTGRYPSSWAELVSGGISCRRLPSTPPALPTFSIPRSATSLRLPRASSGVFRRTDQGDGAIAARAFLAPARLRRALRSPLGELSERGHPPAPDWTISRLAAVPLSLVRETRRGLRQHPAAQLRSSRRPLSELQGEDTAPLSVRRSGDRRRVLRSLSSGTESASTMPRSSRSWRRWWPSSSSISITRFFPTASPFPERRSRSRLRAPALDVSFRDALLGALLGAGLLFLVSEVYFRLRKIEGLGMGDVKMMGMVGAFVGWKGVLLTLFLGSLSGTLVGLVVMASSKGDLRTKLPFGTFLGMGAIATVYAGERLIGWYQSLY